MFDEVLRDRLAQLRLIVLHGNHEVTAPVNDVTKDLFLAAHRVDGHQGICQLDLTQKLGNRCDFVGLLLGGYLTQRDSFLAGPGG